VIQKLLIEDANRLAHSSKFIQRKRKLSGASFAQALVLGWWRNPKASLEELSQCTARAGTGIRAQSLAERFDERSVAFMESLLKQAVQMRLLGESLDARLFRHFKSVWLTDSSVIGLPRQWYEQYPGCGNGQGQSAGLKLQVRLDLKQGVLEGPILQAAREHDRSSPIAWHLEAGECILRDLGFFKLQALAQHQAQGGYWISRALSSLTVYNLAGQRLDWSELLQDGFDGWVGVGRSQLQVRLLVFAVPKKVQQARLERLEAEAKRRAQPLSLQTRLLAAWDIYLCNVPEELLNPAEVRVLARLRWQIELLFKLWKSLSLLDESVSNNPHRILCELFAKLIAVVIQHWCIVATAWSMPQRSSFKLAKLIQSEALTLFDKLSSLQAIQAWLDHLARLADFGCAMQKRRAKPNAFQLISADFS
jgi:hypothetical protein